VLSIVAFDASGVAWKVMFLGKKNPTYWPW